MSITLSKRMQMNASMVPNGSRVADIGCDHGKLAVYLIEKNTATYVVASDIGKGPLERAMTTVKGAGLTDKIDLRLADGANGIKRDESGRPEVDVIVMAGIGGMLALDIVRDSIDIYRDIDCFIIQAQSNIDILRGSMDELGFAIIDEDMVYEDGKFYTAIKYKYSEKISNVTHVSYITCDGEETEVHGSLTEAELSYGPVLISKSHDVLHEHLKKELKKYESIYKDLSGKENPTGRTGNRIEDLTHRIELLSGLLDREWRLH